MRKPSGKRASTIAERSGPSPSTGSVAAAPPRAVPAPFATLRKMELADVPDVAALERGVFPDPWSVDSFVAEVERRCEIGWPLVAHDAEGDLAGYAVVWFIVDEVHIGNIAVRPDLQGQGVGSRLLRYILTEGRRRGFHFATLEVRPSNVAALRLYERYGFRRVAVRAKYYRNDGEDAHVLAVSLEDVPECARG